MNLADAIRKAAETNGVPPVEAPAATAELTVQTREDDFEVIEEEMEEETTFDPMSALAPEPPAPPVAGGSVVRLELFLGPEQLTHLFRAVVATQHSVMTLREAATFLRANPNVLEQMATDGEIPAFMVDGKWRFPKAGLDEWLSLKCAGGRREAV